MKVSEETLLFRSALTSLKKQVKISEKYLKRVVKQKQYEEAVRIEQCNTGLRWAINHIERHLKGVIVREGTEVRDENKGHS